MDSHKHSTVAIEQFASIIKTIINPELTSIHKGLKEDVDTIGNGLTKVASTHDSNLKHLNKRMSSLETIMEKIRLDQEKIIESVQMMLSNNETSSKLLGDFYIKQSKAMAKIIQGFNDLESHTPIKILMEQLKDAKQVRNEVLRTLSRTLKK